jgi:hypothetical protein
MQTLDTDVTSAPVGVAESRLTPGVLVTYRRLPSGGVRVWPDPRRPGWLELPAAEFGRGYREVGP